MGFPGSSTMIKVPGKAAFPARCTNGSDFCGARQDSDGHVWAERLSRAPKLLARPGGFYPPQQRSSPGGLDLVMRIMIYPSWIQSISLRGAAVARRASPVVVQFGWRQGLEGGHACCKITQTYEGALIARQAPA